jgi:hypothetical protein
MDAALVAAVTSFVVATSSAAWTAWENAKARSNQRDLAMQQDKADQRLEALKHQLEQEARREERQWEASAELRQYRDPLLEAAIDLGERIDNLQHRGFLAYFRVGHPRRETARLSTLYRFASYFGMLEIIYGQVGFLRFQQARETKAVSNVLAAIGKTLADDRVEKAPGFGTARLMIWREEQRAIGEVAIAPIQNGRRQCVGFAAFAEHFEKRAAAWFTSFTADLEWFASHQARHPHARSTRLADLQRLLAELVRRLDEDKRYVDEPLWMTREGTAERILDRIGDSTSTSNKSSGRNGH